MSNKSFRVTCAEDDKEVGVVLLVHPDLPQATALMPGSKVMPELTYELAVKSPVHFELRRPLRPGMQHVISINRESGQISYGEIDEAIGFRNVNPAPESTKCTTDVTTLATFRRSGEIIHKGMIPQATTQKQTTIRTKI